MKAPWLIFSLFMAISLSSAQAQSVVRVQMPSDLRNNVNEYLGELETTAAAAEDDPRVRIGQHREDLLDLMEGFYKDGYVTIAQVNQFKSAIDEKQEVPLCVEGAPHSCGNGLRNFFNTFHDEKIRHQEPFCATNSQVATAKKCCGDLNRLPYAAYQPTGSCKPQGNSCSSHSQCCSQLCNMNEDGSAGICAAVFSCYELRSEGQECPAQNPYCEADLFCQKIDYDSSGVGECRSIGNSCSANIDCCSDKCQSGQCVEKSVCLNCAKLGEIPESGQSCCPGSYPSLNGSCIQDFPPFTLPTSVKVKSAIKDLFAALSSLIFPSAHAIGLDDPTIPVGPPTPPTEPATTSTGASCDGVGDDGMTNGQRGEFEQCVRNAMSMADATQDDISQRLEMCDNMKKAFLRENEGCSGEALSRADYKNAYDMPSIRSKTFSDVKECKFNTYNDSWRSMSNQVRNAEIALRAFEVTYSGKGQDMIIAGPGVSATPEYQPANGYSIFSRAKKIAIQLRRNRYDMIKNFEELDEKMTCKCLATFGPGKFGAEKRAFFMDKCDEEKKYVTEQFIQGENDEDGNDNDEATAAAEIDKGAIGITHEKLLVEWLGLRRDLQMRHFTNNESLEEEFKKLSEFVSHYKWIENPNTRHEQGQPLYRFKVKYLPAMLAAIVTAVAAFVLVAGLILASVVTFGFGTALIIAGVVGSLVAMFAPGSDYNPKYHDEKIEHLSNRSWGGWSVSKYDTYDRYLVWARTEGPSASSDMPGNERCEVWREANQCIKNVYYINIEYGEGDRAQSYQNQPLLDVAMPLTVPTNAYLVEKTTPSKTYVKMLNDAYANGRQYLKDNPPNPDGEKDGEIYWKKRNYEDTSAQGPFTSDAALRAFTLEGGNWQPQLFENYKAAFENGVKKYAMCKELVNCDPHSSDGLDSEKDIGFGYLFEEENDANDFAAYVYQMHLIWPRLVGGDAIAYPTLGMDAYFQTMSYNLRLAGSMALRQVGSISEAYDLYMADWEERRATYQGLGGAEEGDTSRNVELSDRFYQAVESLQFTNGVSIEGYNGLIDKLIASGDFNAAETAALNALRRHAIRSAEERKKKAHFDKTVGSTERGKRKMAAASKFMEDFNSPLKKMNLNVGGQNLGGPASQGEGNSGSLAALKSKPSTGENANSKKDQESGFTRTSAYGENPSKFGSSFGGRGSGNGPGYGAEGSSSSDSGSLNSGLTNTEAELMVDAAKKDRSLDEVLPDDTIWRVVSKAYKRNLSRVLVLKSEIQEKKDEKPAKPEISKGEKDELKQLLQNDL